MQLGSYLVVSALPSLSYLAPCLLPPNPDHPIFLPPWVQ